MLADFVNKLTELAKKSSAAEVVQIPGDARRVLLRTGEKFQFEDVPAPDRKIALRGLDDIVELCQDKAIAPAPEIYHSSDAIRVVLNREDRREVAVMQLTKSERFESMVGLRSGRSFNVKDAIRFLRVDLHSTGQGVGELIAGLRRVDFSRQSGTQRTTEHGRETLGRQVESAIQQTDRVPEDFKVSVPVFTNPGLKGITCTMRCAVDIDLDNEKIVISTLADEVQGALDGAQKDIHDALVKALPEVPVLNGTP